MRAALHPALCSLSLLSCAVAAMPAAMAQTVEPTTASQADGTPSLSAAAEQAEQQLRQTFTNLRTLSAHVEKNRVG